MAINDLKTIKEFLEILSNKVGKLETSFRLHISTLHLIKDQQSVMNEKLDNLQVGMDELNKKADQIFKYASEADEDLQDTKKRIKRIEQVPAIAHALK